MDPLIDTAISVDILSEVTPIQISWKTLCKNLSKPKAGEKTGSMFILAKLPQGPCRDKYVEHVSAVVFDVDNKVTNPLSVEMMQDKIVSAGIKAIIYTSYSHTSESPSPITRSATPVPSGDSVNSW